MLNYNGAIINKLELDLPFNNRAFSYGDAVFDTSKITNNIIEFAEDHYFRLMASMRMLRMEIPMNFTLEFFESEILKTHQSNFDTEDTRVKFTVFRNSGGLFTPTTNKISYIIEVAPINNIIKADYTIDLFKDYFVSSNIISTLKTNNRIINVLASIFASENNLDNCVLLNEKKSVVEVANGNIFLIKANEITTPPISDGCIKGIIRNKVMESVIKNQQFILNESTISPFDLLKADAVFITNSILGIQEVKKYRKKTYNSYLVNSVKEGFKACYLLG